MASRLAFCPSGRMLLALMLNSHIVLHLPRATDAARRRKRTWWPRREAPEELELEPKLMALHRAILRAAPYDVIAIWVNGAVASRHVGDDAYANQGALAGALELVRTDEQFRDLRFLLSRRRALHTLVEGALLPPNASIGASLRLSLSSVPALLQRAQGESPADLLERVQQQAGRWELFGEAVDEHARITRQLGDAVQGAFGSPVTVSVPELRFIRPGVEHLMHVRRLNDASDVVAGYRRQPAHGFGAGDPFLVYYFDPCQWLVEWALVDALHRGAYAGPDAVVYDPFGARLYGSAEATRYRTSWQGTGAIRVERALADAPAATATRSALYVGGAIPTFNEVSEEMARCYRPDGLVQGVDVAHPELWELTVDDERSASFQGVPTED